MISIVVVVVVVDVVVDVVVVVWFCFVLSRLFCMHHRRMHPWLQRIQNLTFSHFQLSTFNFQFQYHGTVRSENTLH